MLYRPEIDGLRAIAVLPVIFFHSGISTYGSGFIGVDIFFVISGFLITSILISEMEADQFSLSGFYERRARRILPALFFVILVTLVFATFIMNQNQLEDFSKSAVSALFFASNFYFWLTSSYFSEVSELKPLLHTWSLAVEEQYYLLFPPFLLFVWRYLKKYSYLPILALVLLGILASEWGYRNSPVASFYLLPTRGWEILLGSLAAFICSRSKITPSNLGSIIGCLLLILSFLIFGTATPVPSAMMLLPTLGTALILVFGSSGTHVARVLSYKPLVGLGLISYSIYLWHQPLFAFYRITMGVEIDHWVLVSVMLISVFLGYLTWRLVEQPFRSRVLINTKTALQVLVLAFVVILVFAGSSVQFRQLISPLPTYQNQLIEAEKNARFEGRIKICEKKGWETCDVPEPSLINALFIGDSHAADALNSVYFLREDDWTNEVSFSMSQLGGCPPFLDIAKIVPPTHPDLPECQSLNITQRFNPEFLAEFDIIFLNVLLGWYTSEHLIDYMKYLAKNFDGRVVVYGSAFVFERDIPTFINSNNFIKPEVINTKIRSIILYDPRTDDKKIQESAGKLGYLFVSQAEVLCNALNCSFVDENQTLVSYDRHHLSLDFSKRVGSFWSKEILQEFESVRASANEN